MSRLIQDSSQPVNPVTRIHAWKAPVNDGASRMNLFTQHSVYEAIMEQSEMALPNETGGFLLGQTGFDPDCGSWYNWIDEAVPINPAESNPVHFTFTWRDVDHVRNLREREGKSLIGWYHTHPGLGIFLSETDLVKRTSNSSMSSFRSRSFTILLPSVPAISIEILLDSWMRGLQPGGSFNW